jgi:hypothetical protein
MFNVAFADDVDDTIRGSIEDAERESHIAASLLGARARSIGILDSLARGLAFSDEVLDSYQGDVAEIAATGACIQLLGGASPLVQDQPRRFAKDKILAALDSRQIRQIDTFIKVRFHCGICIIWHLDPFMILNTVHEIAFTLTTQKECPVIFWTKLGLYCKNRTLQELTIGEQNLANGV